MSTISDNIRSILKDKGYTLDCIAKKLGITQGALSQKLNAGDNIKYKTILEISEVTNIPIISFIAYPKEYILKSTYDCEECNRKDLIIEDLREYISLLKDTNSNSIEFHELINEIRILKQLIKTYKIKEDSESNSNATIDNDNKFLELYNELPSQMQKNVRDYIKATTGASRGTIWNWCSGKTRPYMRLEEQFIDFIKTLD